VPDTPFYVWEDNAQGVYCGYLDAELWDDVDVSGWQCYFEQPASRLEHFVVDDGTLVDACEPSLELFSSWEPVAAPVCQASYWSATIDSCDVELDCSVLGSADEVLQLGMQPHFGCTIEAQSAVCVCGSSSVQRETDAAAPTSGWCAELTTECELALEEGAIGF
jgi:hypothetical protein